MNLYNPIQKSYGLFKHIPGTRYVLPLALGGLITVGTVIAVNHLSNNSNTLQQPLPSGINEPLPQNSLDNKMVDNDLTTSSLDNIASRSSLDPPQPTPKPLYLIEEEYYETGRYGSTIQITNLIEDALIEAQDVKKRNELRDLMKHLVLGIADDGYNREKIYTFRQIILERAYNITSVDKGELMEEIEYNVKNASRIGKNGWATYWGVNIIEGCCRKN